MLDNKTSLNINIFLKQFRTSNKEVIAIILQGNTERISLEQLKAFEKLLPDRGTVSAITCIHSESDTLWLLYSLMISFFLFDHFRLTHSNHIMEIEQF